MRFSIVNSLMIVLRLHFFGLYIHITFNAARDRGKEWEREVGRDRERETERERDREPVNLLMLHEATEWLWNLEVVLSSSTLGWTRAPFLSGAFLVRHGGHDFAENFASNLGHASAVGGCCISKSVVEVLICDAQVSIQVCWEGLDRQPGSSTWVGYPYSNGMVACDNISSQSSEWSGFPKIAWHRFRCKRVWRSSIGTRVMPGDVLSVAAWLIRLSTWGDIAKYNDMDADDSGEDEHIVLLSVE